MRIRLILGCMALALCTSLTSCCRSNGEMWENTKTCSRYVGKGFRSLMGQHADSRNCAYNFGEDWDDVETGRLVSRSPNQGQGEYIPLGDTESYHNLETKEYPISMESPGDPGSGLPGIESFYAPSGPLAHVFSNIHFETDNYTVQGSENVAQLREIAKYLSSHRGTYVFVEGHADERGATAYNLALSSKRSNSVRNFLIENGVNPDQIFTISYGVERPLVMGHDEAAWKTNRRAQFKIYDQKR